MASATILLMALAFTLGGRSAVAQEEAEERAREPRNQLNPALPAGVALAVAGGTSMIAGAALLGSREISAEEARGVESASLGLLVGGVTAAAIGIGVSAAADGEPANVAQRDALTSVGIATTGLCAAGVVGSSASLWYSAAHHDPTALGAGMGVAASGAACGLGIPFWIRGMRPRSDRIAARRNRASDEELEGWVVRNPSMTAVGAGMVASGAVLLGAGITRGVWWSMERTVEGGRNTLGGIYGGVMMSLPSVPMFTGGAFLLHHGTRPVPPEWHLSIAPAAGGVAITLQTP